MATPVEWGQSTLFATVRRNSIEDSISEVVTETTGTGIDTGGGSNKHVFEDQELLSELDGVVGDQAQSPRVRGRSRTRSRSWMRIHDRSRSPDGGRPQQVTVGSNSAGGKIQSQSFLL